jgi:GTP cyclohydrolase III
MKVPVSVLYCISAMSCRANAPLVCGLLAGEHEAAVQQDRQDHLQLARGRDQVTHIALATFDIDPVR